MLGTVTAMLGYPFLVRALIVGTLVSLCAALLGTSLVLKRYSMIGDGLAHVGFAALAIAYTFKAAPLSIAIPVCIIAAFFLLRIKESSRIQGDAATALLCSTALAVGVMTVSLTTGMNTDVCNYMFGSILSMSKSDVYLSVVLCLLVLFLYSFFYHKIFAITFDATFAAATGVRANLYDMILAILTACTVVLGMRMMGTLLISSLIVFPSLTAMRVCRTFKGTVFLAGLLAVLCFWAGLVFSYVGSVPTGACIVVTDVAVLAVFCFLEKFRERRREA